MAKTTWQKCECGKHLYYDVWKDRFVKCEKCGNQYKVECDENSDPDSEFLGALEWWLEKIN